MMSKLNIVCADAGSIAAGNFGWFGRPHDGVDESGTEIEKLSDYVVRHLDAGEKVALGFECPLFAPLRNDPQEFLRRRNGETNVNWIAGPGGTVMATGLIELTWLLIQIRNELKNNVPVYLDWAEFSDAVNGLYIWEAFVSGKAKGSSHIDDARIAVEKFHNSLPDPTCMNAINETSVISLAGVALLRSGWVCDTNILSVPCLVIKP